ncbi:sigma-70 family RNA polymerase sigma factor [Nocardioides sp. GY 10113]|uniref:RNA polymerase sigma factor n=1 Tax=Nocardioides sp. GY 10113 TaxID=2569761 RepID=UPI0010A88FD6|nr:sigma-70 family RNA polymerase sigma factor [Nocardioides sp. GY 10113]TIC87830.1 sigma-70 family RNA polymerase sigma factor [Nocardioides sp. GY 10113]
MASGADGDLVSGARRGDEDAWRGLYQLHARRLVVLLSTLPSGDSATAADDIAAEAWTVAATKIGEFKGSDLDFGGWLISIARNIAANHRRRSARRQTYPADDAGATEVARDPAPDSLLESDDTTRRLLAHLSPREAEVIACIDVVGLDVAATARALGMSATAVRVARHRGLGRLRTLMGAKRPVLDRDRV